MVIFCLFIANKIYSFFLGLVILLCWNNLWLSLCFSFSFDLLVFFLRAEVTFLFFFFFNWTLLLIRYDNFLLLFFLIFLHYLRLFFNLFSFNFYLLQSTIIINLNLLCLKEHLFSLLIFPISLFLLLSSHSYQFLLLLFALFQR